MLRTEDEALQTRCCGPAGCGHIRFYNSAIDMTGNPRLCAGSSCMAWRWFYYTERHAQQGTSDASGGGPAKGFCGLAGQIPGHHISTDLPLSQVRA
jgi:hypothetical protein